MNVIFGTGPLGKAVMKALLKRGKSVRMVNRSGQADVPEGVEVKAGDANDLAFTRQVTAGAEAVFQCAQPPYNEWVEKFPPFQAAILEGAAASGAKFIAAENLMFSTGDGSGLLAVEDTNIIIHMMAFPDVKGNQAHVDAIKGIVAGASAPITHQWFEVTGAGDMGSVRWTETDKIAGKDVTYQGAYFLKIKDGKIIEAWLVSDMLTYFLAAGIVQYTPAPAQ